MQTRRKLGADAGARAAGRGARHRRSSTTRAARRLPHAARRRGHGPGLRGPHPRGHDHRQRLGLLGRQRQPAQGRGAERRADRRRARAPWPAGPRRATGILKASHGPEHPHQRAAEAGHGEVRRRHRRRRPGRPDGRHLHRPWPPLHRGARAQHGRRPDRPHRARRELPRLPRGHLGLRPGRQDEAPGRPVRRRAARDHHGRRARTGGRRRLGHRHRPGAHQGHGRHPVARRRGQALGHPRRGRVRGPRRELVRHLRRRPLPRQDRRRHRRRRLGRRRGHVPHQVRRQGLRRAPPRRAARRAHRPGARLRRTTRWSSSGTRCRARSAATSASRLSTYENVKTRQPHRCPVDGVFFYIGQVPNTAFLQGVVDLDEQGYIVHRRALRTKACGVFACGDARAQRPQADRHGRRRRGAGGAASPALPGRARLPGPGSRRRRRAAGWRRRGRPPAS